MVENSLTEGVSRLGWLDDGKDTPDIAVMMQDINGEIVMTLPTKGIFSSDDPYSRWFGGGAQWADDPERKKFSYSPPRTLGFRDGDGPVVLVGCRALGHQSGMSAGVGRIVANYAILGGRNLRYEKINRMRSEIPALFLWSGLRSRTIKHESDENGLTTKLQLHLESPPDVTLDRALNLTLQPAWRTSSPDQIGTISAHDIVYLTTNVQKPALLEEHVRLHEGVRELLVLSSWNNVGYKRIEVSRSDVPLNVDLASAQHPYWSELKTYRLPKHADWKREPRFLFHMQDIGAAGVRSWLRIRRHFRRTFQPLLGVAQAQGHYLETRMLLVGLAMEALGYQLEVDDGGHGLDKWGRLSFPAALKKILSTMEYIPLNNQDVWRENARLCYNGVKHADNSLPDSLVLANTMRESLLVLRVWLAGRLGCDPEALESRVDWDPLANPYVASS